ncbi:TPA: hypothetical protein HA244_04855 [Candidatus Micrarchaeota archaeon]|nr:hypothetical protein [Candidatus Micrarchaeota archaeon]
MEFKQPNRRKGFATAIFVALAVLALAFFATALFTKNTGFQNAQLEADITSERFEDARDFLNETQEDAIVDAAYAVYGCTPSAPDFCADYQAKFSIPGGTYYATSAGKFPDVSITPDPQNPASCTFLGQQGNQFIFDVSQPAIIKKQATRALREQAVDFQKRVVITQNTGAGGRVMFFEVATGEHDFPYTCP